MNIDKLNPPKSLVIDGNLVENWKCWKQDFTLYIAATEYTKKPNPAKSSLLIHCIGQKGSETYNNFTFENQEDTLIHKKRIKKFKEYIAPRKNLTYSHFKFLTYR